MNANRDRLAIVLGIDIDESNIADDLKNAKSTLEKIIKGEFSQGLKVDNKDILKDLFTLPKNIKGSAGTNEWKKSLQDVFKKNFEIARREISIHGDALQKEILENIIGKAQKAVTASIAASGPDKPLGMLGMAGIRDDVLRQLGLTKGSGGQYTSSSTAPLVESSVSGAQARRFASQAQGDAKSQERLQKAQEKWYRQVRINSNKLAGLQEEAYLAERERLRKNDLNLAKSQIATKQRNQEGENRRKILFRQYKEAGLSESQLEKGIKIYVQALKDNQGKHSEARLLAKSYFESEQKGITQRAKSARVGVKQQKDLAEANKLLNIEIDKASKIQKYSQEDISVALSRMGQHWDRTKPGSTPAMMRKAVKFFTDSVKQIAQDGEKAGEEVEFLAGDRTYGSQLSSIFQRGTGQGSGSFRIGEGQGMVNPKNVKELTKQHRLLSDAMDRVFGAKGQAGLQRFEKEFNEVIEATGNFEVAVKAATKESTTFFTKNMAFFGKLAFQIGIFRQISGALTGFSRELVQAGQAMVQLGQASAEYADQTDGFGKLVTSITATNAAYVNSGVLLAEIKNAAGGTIDEMGLMQSATQAALSGISPDKIAPIVSAARTLASVTGRDATESFNRLTNAIAKQERRLLDELGIVVRANDLYQDYAEKHNLATSAMTAQQKQAAFLEGTLEAVEMKVASLGGAVESNQRMFIEYDKAIRNVRLQIGDLIRENDLFASSLQGLTQWIRGIGNAWRTESAKADDFLAALNSVRNSISSINELVNAPASGGVSAIDAAIAIAEKLDSIDPLSREYADSKEELENYVLRFRKYAPELGAYLNSLGKGHKDFAIELRAFREEIKSQLENEESYSDILFGKDRDNRKVLANQRQNLEEASENHENFLKNDSKIRKDAIKEAEEGNSTLLGLTAYTAAGGAAGYAVGTGLVGALALTGFGTPAALALMALGGGAAGFGIGKAFGPNYRLTEDERVKRLKDTHDGLKRARKSSSDEYNKLVEDVMTLHMGGITDSNGEPLNAEGVKKMHQEIRQRVLKEVSYQAAMEGRQFDEFSEEVEDKVRELMMKPFEESLKIPDFYGGAHMRYDPERFLEYEGQDKEALMSMFYDALVSPAMTESGLYVTESTKDFAKRVSSMATEMDNATKGLSDNVRNDGVVKSVSAVLGYQKRVEDEIRKTLKTTGYSRKENEDDLIALLKSSDSAAFSDELKNWMSKETFDELRSLMQGALSRTETTFEKVASNLSRQYISDANDEGKIVKGNEAGLSPDEAKKSILNRQVDFLTRLLNIPHTEDSSLNQRINSELQKQIDIYESRIEVISGRMSRLKEEAEKRAREKTEKDAQSRLIRKQSAAQSDYAREVGDIVRDSLIGVSNEDAIKIIDSVTQGGKVNLNYVKSLAEKQGALGQYRIQTLLGLGAEAGQVLMTGNQELELVKELQVRKLKARDAITRDIASEEVRSVVNSHIESINTYKNGISLLKASKKGLIDLWAELQTLSIPVPGNVEDDSPGAKQAKERMDRATKQAVNFTDLTKEKIKSDFKKGIEGIEDTIIDLGTARPKQLQSLINRLDKARFDSGMGDGDFSSNFISLWSAVFGMDSGGGRDELFTRIKTSIDVARGRQVDMVETDIKLMDKRNSARKKNTRESVEDAVRAQYQQLDATLLRLSEEVKGNGRAAQLISKAREKYRKESELEAGIAGTKFINDINRQERKLSREYDTQRLKEKEVLTAQESDLLRRMRAEQLEDDVQAIRDRATEAENQAGITDQKIRAIFQKGRIEEEAIDEQSTQDRLDASLKIASSMGQMFPNESLSKALSFISGFKSIRSDIENFGKAFSQVEGAVGTLGTFLGGGVGSGVVGGLLMLGTTFYGLYTNWLENIRRISKETREAIERQKRALIEQGKEIGSSIGQSISEGLVIDPRSLVQEFLKKQFLDSASEVLGAALGKPMQEATQALQGAIFGAQGRKGIQQLTDDLVKDVAAGKVAGAEAQARVQLEKDLKGLRKVGSPENIAELLAGIGLDVGFSWDDLAYTGSDANLWRNAALDLGPENIIRLFARGEARRREGMGAGFDAANLTRQVEDIESGMRPVLDSVLQAFGIDTDSAASATGQYGVPTATFSAVTEPQANNMLVMMTRQVNYLARIATNTDFLPQMALAQNMGGGVAIPSTLNRNGDEPDANRELVTWGAKKS